LSPGAGDVLPPTKLPLTDTFLTTDVLLPLEHRIYITVQAYNKAGKTNCRPRCSHKEYLLLQWNLSNPRYQGNVSDCTGCRNTQVLDCTSSTVFHKITEIQFEISLINQGVYAIN
jgi:hypothetical protein